MVRPTLRHRLRASILAVVALVAGVGLMASATSPASAGQIKGSLVITSVTDDTGLVGGVAGRPMSVVVTRLDLSGALWAPNQDSAVKLSASGPGTLSGTTSGTIPAGASSATITGAVYDTVANGVTLTARETSGPALNDGTISVNIAHTAFTTLAKPNQALNVTDPGCPAPTPDMPVCGFLLLDNGGNGAVLMSVGSCDKILNLTCRTSRGATAELVTASVNLKNTLGDPLYTPANPATLVLACDKTLCGNGGVGQFPVTIDLTDTGAFTSVADCPAKGVLGTDQDACVDQVQSTKNNAGDVYTYILFVHDIRGSYP